MAIRGERFHVDLSSDEEDTHHPSKGEPAASLSIGLLGDIKERSSDANIKPPSAPQLKFTSSGFPEHKKRSRESAFKRHRAEANATGRQAASSHPDTHPADPGKGAPANGGASDFETKERRKIDQENKERLANMSAEEIRQEQQELMNGLSPSLIEMLLKRANIDEETTGKLRDPIDAEKSPAGVKSESKPAPKTVRFEQDTVDSPPADRPAETHPFDPDAAPLHPPEDLRPAGVPHKTSKSQVPFNADVHFPQPPDDSTLDPNDPSFLDHLRTKYFPNLATDPSKLAWMAPLPSANSQADHDSPYSPHQDSLTPSAIRFDFRGDLLPPRSARQIPITKGLHHHGEAPEAAGYTVPELARLARSAFPAQRCVAYQTLGRLLFRLGKGYLGDEGSDLVKGLWRCIEEGRVIEALQEEAGRESGHVSAKAYATEALWNWQKGGGKRWKAE